MNSVLELSQNLSILQTEDDVTAVDSPFEVSGDKRGAAAGGGGGSAGGARRPRRRHAKPPDQPLQAN